MRRTAVSSLGLGALAAVAVFVSSRAIPSSLPPASEQALVVQEVETELFIAANVASLPSSPLTVSVLSVTLAPGAFSHPAVNDGPTLVFVEEGHLVVDSDRPVTGPNPAGTPLGGILMTMSVRLDEGQQVSIPGGARVRLRNPDTERARLLVVALTFRPEAARSLPARTTSG